MISCYRRRRSRLCFIAASGCRARWNVESYRWWWVKGLLHGSGPLDFGWPAVKFLQPFQDSERDVGRGPRLIARYFCPRILFRKEDLLVIWDSKESGANATTIGGVSRPRAEVLVVAACSTPWKRHDGVKFFARISGLDGGKENGQRGRPARLVVG